MRAAVQAAADRYDARLHMDCQAALTAERQRAEELAAQVAELEQERDAPFTDDTLRIGGRIMEDIRACSRVEDVEGFCACARGFLRWIQTMREARTNCRAHASQLEHGVRAHREALDTLYAVGSHLVAPDAVERADHVDAFTRALDAAEALLYPDAAEATR